MTNTRPLLILLAVVALTACGGAQAPRTTPHELLGQAPESATRPTLNGEMVEIPAPGKITVLDFWATFCEPCLEEMPAIERWWRTVDKNRVQVIGISMDDNSYIVEQKLTELRITFPQLIDDGFILKGRYLVDSVPAAFVIDATGKIRHFSAADAYSADDIIKAAETLLAG
jgi:peroxiredoxin